jgi:hypothetical protein
MVSLTTTEQSLSKIAPLKSYWSKNIKYDIKQFYSVSVLRRLQASAGITQQGGLAS